MLKIIVIADDLTGGNANSILLKKEGINVVTVVETAMDVTGFEAAVYSTNSREIPQSEAFDRVYQLSEKLKDQGAVLFSKRIDSTLRGRRCWTIPNSEVSTPVAEILLWQYIRPYLLKAFKSLMKFCPWRFMEN